MPKILLPTMFKNGLAMLVTGLAIAAGGVAAWCYWGHHFWTALKGPTEITLAELAKIDDPAQFKSTWVKVKFDKAVKSEVVLEATQAGNSRVEEEYLIFQAGERWMIACVPEGFKGNELSGQIWTRGHGLAREAVAAITKELQDVHHGELFPFEFDASEDYASKWKVTAGIIGFIAAAGVFFGVLGLNGMQRGCRPPRPEEYGLSPEDYAHLVIETPEDAVAAVDLFLRDAGLERTEPN
jgi:hypothetical protein